MVVEVDISQGVASKKSSVAIVAGRTVVIGSLSCILSMKSLQETQLSRIEVLKRFGSFLLSPQTTNAEQLTVLELDERK